MPSQGRLNILITFQLVDWPVYRDVLPLWYVTSGLRVTINVLYGTRQRNVKHALEDCLGYFKGTYDGLNEGHNHSWIFALNTINNGQMKYLNIF